MRRKAASDSGARGLTMANEFCAPAVNDIRTQWFADRLYGDWDIDPPALASGHHLETAVLISLFTDRLAEPADRLPSNDGNRKGWWADTGKRSDERIGSRLWLLHREKQSNETRLRAEEYAHEALAWMLRDEVADMIDVAATWLRLGWLDLDITIWRQDRRLFHGRFQWTWTELLTLPARLATIEWTAA